MSAFKMPKPVRVTGLGSSVTESLINGIVPCTSPSEGGVRETLSVLGMTAQGGLLAGALSWRNEVRWLIDDSEVEGQGER